jgi:hypothetical protein
MTPHMTDSEIQLFLSFLRNSQVYVEFGCGGSTVLAAMTVTDKVISVDSDIQYINKVKEATANCKLHPDIHYINIGPVGEWSTPTDSSFTNEWINYYSSVWNQISSRYADLFLVDGRFRVACFAQIYLNSHQGSIVAIHDFPSRHKHYYEILELGKVIASTDDISFFSLYTNKRSTAKRILQKHLFDYK